MKQTFIIETKKGISGAELFGCLEDTIGQDKVISVEELLNEKRTS